MAQTYPQLAQELATLLNTSVSNPNYINELSNAITFAETMIVQDLDPLSTYSVDSSTAFTLGSPNYTAPATFVIVTQLAFITPVATVPDSGVRHPLEFVSTDFLNFIWPTRAVATVPYNVPKWVAPLSQNTFIVAPTPDAAYTVEVTGTRRPTPLSPANPITSLLTLLPSLMNAACMIYLSGVQKNFGSQADNPAQAVSWTGVYQKLLTSAEMEEARKKFQGPGWNPYLPTPVATPPRS